MELMSRTHRHQTAKKKTTDASWFLGILFAGCVVYPLRYFWRIPDEMAYKQTLLILLFLLSVFFLSLYVLAFFIVSTKTYIQSEEKTTRINYAILFFWIASFLYHFIGWLTVFSERPSLFYHVGMAIALTAFILTVIHFLAYFRFMRKEKFVIKRQEALKSRQLAYESIQRILRARQLVMEAMDRNPEVKQMMKWNGFDQQMDRWVTNIERCLRMTDFSDRELRNILGVKAWMENITMIIEQHPQHRGLSDKLNEIKS